MQDNSPLSGKMKSFWQKPEGKAGKFFLWAGGAVAVWAAVNFLDSWLPMLVRVLQNAIHATILGAVLTALIVVLTNKRFRTIVSYLFQSIMHFLTGLLIEIDPIGIMRSYVGDLKRKYSNIEAQMSKVKGHMRALREKIEENKRITQDSMRMAQEAQRRVKAGDKSMRTSFTLYSRKASRRKDSNMTYEQMITKMEFIYRILEKMREASAYYIEDISDQVEVLTEKRKNINAAYGAYQSAMGIIKDGSEKRAIFDQTVEFLKDDYGQQLGQIESFIDLSAGFIDAVDLENGMMEREALDELEKWEQKADDMILGTEKT
ncbi:MAG: hypothetical protein E4H40_04065, partial [Candidatus Brocadiia bacterium]